MPTERSISFLRMLDVASKLKTVKRVGWFDQMRGRGVPKQNAESAAEHVFGMLALVGLMSLDKENYKNINFERLFLLVVFHELPERNGDTNEHYTADDPEQRKKLREDKFHRESVEMEKIAAELGPIGNKVIELWTEFELAKTPEAKLAKQLDRLVDAHQAAVYQALLSIQARMEFFWSASERVDDPELEKLLGHIRKRLPGGEIFGD